MARHKDLAELSGIDVYFCDPHPPWQRPTNENGNGLLRHYVGKSTDLARYGTDDLRAIEHRLDALPRRRLGWSTAHGVYSLAVAMTGCTRHFTVTPVTGSYGGARAKFTRNGRLGHFQFASRSRSYDRVVPKCQ